ncbi:hypothetical protein P9E76_00040 [Schinkia azotoformans]|uniref:Uncharacterized protein n=1 Tax=Schinkia azotoformans LMG 9581 TaxID=1131731 RepID=K6C0H3_SCHAZ|nr:hypothetical protein [Schinkia azotoformans]EKN64650.1 hypothetical protein BAZO_12894 [Schinkia azotoformans LMG 9581]MEC1640037.1 hypothetical protein [Schinkia azotoformans]MEC1722646.1 hypothetical protein [Schinkia azotoformans]MEC1943475.1 hypothetical protein [Schinkia azotoformans]MED4354864.1 hypothetical protein [Schinkia azotoformans]
MEEILKQILNEINNLKEGQERIAEKVTNVDSKVDSLDSKAENILSEMRSNFRYINDKLDEHRKVFDVVSDEIKSVKIDIEYLSSKTGKHDTELNNILNRLRG